MEEKRDHPRTIICVGCGSSFETTVSDKKFCLKSCAAKYRKKKYRDRIKEFRCTVCQKIFSANEGSTVKKFCSLECRRIKQPLVEHKAICSTCGLKFVKSYGGKKYCSSACRPSKSKIERTCQRCNKTFTGSNWKYCSKACANGSQAIVYFILGRLTNRLKVGLTTQFHKRFDGMQRGNWDDLEVLGTIPGGFEEEQTIHKELESHRTHYEFYDYCPEVKAVVARYLNLN